MTQQYIAEGMAFTSDAMPHGRPAPLAGSDERWLEQDIHAQIQGPSGPVPGPRIPESRLNVRRRK
ncbi:MAG: hypothetical protein ACAI44_31460 [Candidatus Sericytochromatia bacterium]